MGALDQWSKHNKLTNKFEKKLILDYPLGILDYPLGILDYPHWVDQSEAASHTMRHVLSLPLILFPFALDHWKRGSVTNPSCVDNLPCPCENKAKDGGSYENLEKYEWQKLRKDEDKNLN